jgi:hypothetical protein
MGIADRQDDFAGGLIKNRSSGDAGTGRCTNDDDAGSDDSRFDDNP